MKVTKEQLVKMIQNNEDVSNVDTSDITDMSFLFFENKNFNQDISKWNVSNVRNMSFMFSESKFNGDVSTWNVSKVKNISYMFYDTQFNKNMFNLKEKIKSKKIYSKNMNFINNNLVVG